MICAAAATAGILCIHPVAGSIVKLTLPTTVPVPTPPPTPSPTPPHFTPGICEPTVGPCSEAVHNAWMEAATHLHPITHPSATSDPRVFEAGPDGIYGTDDDTIDNGEADDFEAETVSKEVTKVTDLGVAAALIESWIIADSTWYLPTDEPFSNKLLNEYQPAAHKEVDAIMELKRLLLNIEAALCIHDAKGLRAAANEFLDAWAAKRAECGW